MSAEAIQDEISFALRRLADPVVAGESVKACLRRAAVRAGVPYGVAKRFWYREAKQIPAHIYVQIKDKAAAHDRKLKTAMFASIAAMQECDPEFFRENIEAIGGLLFSDGNTSHQGRDKD